MASSLTSAFKKMESLAVPRWEKAARAIYEQTARSLEQFGEDYARHELATRAGGAGFLPLLPPLYRASGLAGFKATRAEIERAASRKASAAFGNNRAWEAVVKEYLKQEGLNLAQNVEGTVKRDIIKILQKATAQGWSIDKTIEELKTTKLPHSRARVIVRTELIRAQNIGHAAGALSLPYEVTKEWSAAKDHRTRHGHTEVHKTAVNEFGRFKVNLYREKKAGRELIGSDFMLFPGDPTAKAGNVCNCRCRVIYKPKRNPDGSLMMRNQPGATEPAVQPVTGGDPVSTAPRGGVLAGGLGFLIGNLIGNAIFGE